MHVSTFNIVDVARKQREFMSKPFYFLCEAGELHSVGEAGCAGVGGLRS